MKTYNKPGAVMFAIQEMNTAKPLLLPEGCGQCRFFRKYRRDNAKAENGYWMGECVLARGRLSHCPGMDEVTCPLEFLEGVDNRIWEKGDTNPWFSNVGFLLSETGMVFRIEKIERLKAALEKDECEVMEQLRRCSEGE